jgi:VanZ family protein
MRADSSSRRLALWLPPVVCMVLIFISSAQQDPAPALTDAFSDKWLHLAGYACLAFLFSRAFMGEELAFAVALFCAFLATTTYGATDEWHQAFTPGRNSDVRDWVADTTGAAFGVGMYAVTRRRARRSDA